MDCIRIHSQIPSPAFTAIPWDPPQSIMFSISSIRDDPLPNRTVLRSRAPSSPASKSISTPKSTTSATLLTTPSCLKHPIYSSSDPQVIDLLDDCSSSTSESCPLLSQHPRWVLIVAALSTYYHPSHPAHLAFWRPDIMNETAEMIDKFLKTREAKFLQSREGWIDAEISLYTLRGYQRGYYPDLYSPNQITRTLRKRKVGLMAASRGDEPDAVLDEEEERSKTRARRMTRRSATMRKRAVMENEPDSGLTSTLEEDPFLSNPVVQPVPTKARTRNKKVDEQKQPSPLDVPTVSTFKGHRRRSSSMTSSGVSLSNSVTTTDTLVDEDKQNDVDTRSVASADTAVESDLDVKDFARNHVDIPDVSLEKLALLVDVAAASAPSRTSETLPPSTRRSMRTVRPPKRRREMEEEEEDEREVVVERPRTRLSTGSTHSAAAKQSKKAKRF